MGAPAYALDNKLSHEAIKQTNKQTSNKQRNEGNNNNNCGIYGHKYMCTKLIWKVSPNYSISGIRQALFLYFIVKKVHGFVMYDILTDYDFGIVYSMLDYSPK